MQNKRTNTAIINKAQGKTEKEKKDALEELEKLTELANKTLAVDPIKVNNAIQRAGASQFIEVKSGDVEGMGKLKSAVIKQRAQSNPEVFETQLNTAIDQQISDTHRGQFDISDPSKTNEQGISLQQLREAYKDTSGS